MFGPAYSVGLMVNGDIYAMSKYSYMRRLRLAAHATRIDHSCPALHDHKDFEDYKERDVQTLLRMKGLLNWKTTVRDQIALMKYC